MKKIPMKKAALLLLTFLSMLSLGSCNKVRDYFRNPDPSPLVETIHATSLTAYAANMSFAMMDGQHPAHVTFVRSNAGFPCTTLMTIDATGMESYPAVGHGSSVTVAGLWADASTAIFSLMITKYEAIDQTISVLGIKTVPAIRDGDHITLALASMDIQLNPDEDALLMLNLNTLEVQSELFRLDAPRPNDVYVAVLQDAYFVDIVNNGTSSLADDTYKLTGGGQLIEVQGQDAEITQQAMVDVTLSSDCHINPVSGMALMKVTGLEDQGFPELGTAVFEFHSGCSGTAGIYAATGMYIASNGKDVPFGL
jgi:hypothetical protein